MTDAERIQWYENQHTLHKTLELTYCVDSYLLECLDESGEAMWSVQEPTLAECIDSAASQFTSAAEPK
jgi:hypothetical protein